MWAQKLSKEGKNHRGGGGNGGSYKADSNCLENAIFIESALHKRQSATSVIDMDILTKIAEPIDKLNVER